ncbi:MAG: leucyl aminopeptidase family protein [Acidimicrobiales bacterium]
MPLSARVTTPTEGATRATVVVPVIFDQGEAAVASTVPAVIGGHSLPRSFSAAWCAQQGLKEKPGSATVVRSFAGLNVALVNVGSTLNDLDHYRLAGAAAVRCAGEGDVAFLLPTDGLDDPRAVAQALVEGALLSSYRFKSGAPDSSFDVVPLGEPLPSISVHDQVSEGVRRGTVIARGVNWAKRLVDTPAGDLPPKRLAKAARDRLEGDPFVTIEVWNASRIDDERLGGLRGVSRGSGQPPRLVRATYDPEPGAALPHVALVGKGVTFDSGGLSIKTADAMKTMKTDMTGAAEVLAALSIASRLGLQVKVTAIAPMAENLPGADATKPGDVLTTRNGTTIEVLDTDAEGRLLLADGLALAVEANPDAIIDVATLTGAQVIALGDEIGAYFASTEELSAYVEGASRDTGEPFWRLPLYPGYEAYVESDVADVKNIGKPRVAGTVTAALILQRFTGGRPWVHLDIAGPSRADADRGYVTKGGTAFGLRTLVALLGAVADDVAPA